MSRTYGGILDYETIKNHKMKDLSPEKNREFIKSIRNFENAHLKAYLKGYKYFRYHGQVYEVKQGDSEVHGQVSEGSTTEVVQEDLHTEGSKE